MHLLAGERLSAGDVRVLGCVQASAAGHQRVRKVLLLVCSDHSPHALVRQPAGFNNFGAQPDVVGEAVVIRHGVQILEDLRLAGKEG